MMEAEAEPEAFPVLRHIWLVGSLLFEFYLVGVALHITSHGNNMIHLLII